MNQFEKRVNKLENEHGVGAKSRALTDSESEFILFSCNLGTPEGKQITRADINDDDFLEDGRFPWRSSGPANAIGVHLFALREVNARKRKERKVQ